MLEGKYKKILCIARDDSSVSHGASFDLMYVNPHLGGKQFAFLRGNDMLVAVNFADSPVETDILIPAHAFDFLEMDEGSVTATDLLTGKGWGLDLKRDNAVNVTIPANGGIVLKW